MIVVTRITRPSRLRRFDSSSLSVAWTESDWFSMLQIARCAEYVSRLKSLPSKQVQDNADDYADYDAGRDRKIEAITLALDIDITGQVTEPRDSSTEREK